MKSVVRGIVVAGLISFAAVGSVQAQQLTEGFENATFPPTGWIVRNQSAVIGSNPTCWNRFTTAPWAPNTGAGHAGGNFNCTSGANTISGWLIAAPLINLQNGQTVTFFTRKGDPDSFADRLEVRLCLDATPDSCGAAGSTGTTSTDVGSFTTLLTSVNPTLALGVYPVTYTMFSATLSGLPAGPNTGRIAFRYFVTNGGPSGANSDIMSIDDVAVSGTTPVSLQKFSVD